MVKAHAETRRRGDYGRMDTGRKTFNHKEHREHKEDREGRWGRVGWEILLLRGARCREVGAAALQALGKSLGLIPRPSAWAVTLRAFGFGCVCWVCAEVYKFREEKI